MIRKSDYIILVLLVVFFSFPEICIGASNALITALGFGEQVADGVWGSSGHLVYFVLFVLVAGFVLVRLFYEALKRSDRVKAQALYIMATTVGLIIGVSG